MGTVRRDGRGPAGLPDAGSVCGEPVDQGPAGTQHTEHSANVREKHCRLDHQTSPHWEKLESQNPTSGLACVISLASVFSIFPLLFLQS